MKHNESGIPSPKKPTTLVVEYKEDMIMIKKCDKCGYTLQDVCSKCGGKTRTAHPPRFSATDKYAKYRRTQIL